MTVFTQELDRHPGLIGKLGKFVENIAVNTARAREIEALQSLSDAELAEHGLDRAGIVRHVCRGRAAI